MLPLSLHFETLVGGGGARILPRDDVAIGIKPLVEGNRHSLEESREFGVRRRPLEEPWVVGVFAVVQNPSDDLERPRGGLGAVLVGEGVEDEDS